MSDEALTSSDLILERLTKLHPKLIDLSLDRTWRLLNSLGNPERALPPVFHIAGTNGKGSVSAYLRAALEAGGYLTHSYTSPHLVRFHERIRLAGRPRSSAISEQDLSRLLDECERANNGAPITFFEITTAAALLAFSRASADALILEVGMGGRLDTTNVVAKPAVSIITPVDLDHQAFLGNTIGSIASEKAGILRPGVAAVIGPQVDEAFAAIEAAADRVGARLFIHGQDFTAHEEGGALTYQDEAGLLDLPLPRLPGRHQIDNAGVAICALRQAGMLPLEREAIARGMREVEWPARLQRLTTGPIFSHLPPEAEVWLDGGHNPAAGRAVAEAMADLAEREPEGEGRPLILICGMLDTKDAAGFFAPFRGLVSHVETIAIPGADAGLPADRLAAAAQEAGLDATPAAHLDQALERVAVAAGRAMPRLLICGSLYLAGHILKENA
ncbi:FolC bifunctional protein [Parvibaculum lavamentivorans DS-1]|uniref:tetrahydrofolate synthase n=1 Tax=Parvibaculum lavamentivorans (strain DS-1 / DSM 13023 / NCIMB 13966) TaxID=402881 RepID=A7HPD0_PARL1|nr:folylpolyglutamate synthase/dihydrofolate synthase family protein [Parvibaculum lavamentivorans]ABS61763.1 FolC bifunctional protein [Parvibaculum lavamentivorans DS-1]